MLHPLHLLIIEPIPTTRTGIEVIVKQLPCAGKVFCTKSGTEAVTFALSFMPHVILLNAVLDDMNVETCVEQLKAIAPTAVFIVTGGITSTNQLMALKRCGVKGFMQSKFDGYHLENAIKDTVAEHYYFGGLHGNEYAKHIIKTEKLRYSSYEYGLTDSDKQTLIDILDLLTVKEAADKHGTKPKAIEAARTRLFQKLGVTSALGAALVALRKRIVIDPEIND